MICASLSQPVPCSFRHYTTAFARRLAEAVADVARGQRASSLGTGAALLLLLEHCPLEVSAFSPEWGVLESATRFITTVRREGALSATVNAWDACAEFVNRQLRRIPDLNVRAAVSSGLLSQPGACER